MNTNNLITDLIAAMIPVAQKYVDQQTENNKPGTQLSIVKEEKPTSLKDLTIQRIANKKRFKKNDMIQMVNLKIKKKTQNEIAEACNTSQSRVSLYLKEFTSQYKEIQKSA